MKTVFIYSDEFASYSYGPEHPLKPIRLKLTYDLIRSYGLLDLPNSPVIPAKKASRDEVAWFHHPHYIQVVEEANSGFLTYEWGLDFGLGPGDNPVFSGVYDWSLLVTGATLQAARLVQQGEADIAFNISGGLHHAAKSRASGFCYFNDIVVAICYLLQQGKRIAYIDVDVHHGDGVQNAFYDTDQVLTISLHESGYFLFPGTGFEHEIGEGQGRGYSVNIPYYPGADDEAVVYGFLEVVPPLIKAFQPDILITQLGVDSFRTDPLAHANVTTHGFCQMVTEMRKFGLPWIALGGGGYDLHNVARAWTLAWAIMNHQEVDLPDELPADYLSEADRLGLLRGTRLRDPEYKLKIHNRDKILKELDKSVKYIKKEVFPIIGAR
jgi:acetoin utilization protein AcuC